jgi:hypothetical protein
LLDYLLHEGNDLLNLTPEIFDDKGAEKTDAFLPVQATRKLLQILFITSDYSQLDHLYFQPPDKICFTGILSAKLNPQKTSSLKRYRVYA